MEAEGRERGWGGTPSPPAKASGEHCKLPERGPVRNLGRRRICGNEKALKTHVGGINVVSFVAQKFVHSQIKHSQIKLGEGRSPPTALTLATPMYRTSLIHELTSR